MFRFLLIFAVPLVSMQGQKVEGVSQEMKKIENLEEGMKKMMETISYQQNMISSLENEIEKMKQSHRDQQITIQELKNLVEDMRDPPISFHCVYQNEYSGTGPVAYDSIFYNRTNEWTMEGGMDLESGRYTASFPGTYSITYSLAADTYKGKKA